MHAHEVTAEWLAALSFKVQHVADQPTIDGVLFRPLKVHLDGRGEVTELWSAPWSADGIATPQHVYQSATDYSVVKAWHLHELHTDQFTVTRGKLQLVVADVREDSATFGNANSFILGTLNPALVQIPPGLVHGWKALTPPEVIVVNLQTRPYEPHDEFKFPWDCTLRDVWEPRNG
jgi:dTDP-4-dehydrorhamnose 3,5-epimerase